MTLTYLDSGVLLAAIRGGTAGQRARDILADPARQFASSVFVRLEVEPKARYYQRTAELAVYQRFFEFVAAWATVNDALVEDAYREAMSNGMAALDALHVACARQVAAAELITTEQQSKPIYRAQGLRVVTLSPE